MLISCSSKGSVTSHSWKQRPSRMSRWPSKMWLSTLAWCAAECNGLDLPVSIWKKTLWYFRYLGSVRGSMPYNTHVSLHGPARHMYATWAIENRTMVWRCFGKLL